MLINIFWIALTNIKRNKHSTILYFLMYLILTTGIFSSLLSISIVKLPPIGPLKDFFYSITILILLVSISVLFGLSYINIIHRKTEIAIYRIFGIRKSDLFFMLSLEGLMISTAGALTGITLTLTALFGAQSVLIDMIKSIYESYIKIILFSALRALFTVMVINILITITVFALNSKKEMEKLLRGIF